MDLNVVLLDVVDVVYSMIKWMYCYHSLIMIEIQLPPSLESREQELYIHIIIKINIHTCKKFTGTQLERMVQNRRK